MDKKTYDKLEGYMLSCMADAAHDREHIYRVLSYALEIAEGESAVDYDVLITACLLHDIGRKEQFADPKLCHAKVGSEKAFGYLLGQGFSTEFAEKVHRCIRQHRFRANDPPDSPEAKILFDADKLDVTGAMGIARTLQYGAGEGEPLYCRDAQGRVLDGTENVPSFLREYKFKLEHICNRFCTEKGKTMAMERQATAVAFYESFLQEVRSAHEQGKARLEQLLHA